MVDSAALAVITFQSTVIGLVFAALGLGFNIVYRVSKSINLAHPAIVLLAVYVTLVASSYLASHGLASLGFALGTLVAAVVGFATGVAMEITIARPLRGRPPVALIAATLGAYYILKGVAKAVARDMWTTASYRLPGISISLGPVVVDATDIAAIVLAGGTLAALIVLHRFTRLGVAMRAVAEDPYGASAYGLPVKTLTMLSWGLAGLAGALAGVALASKTGVEPSIDLYVLEALAASLLAGLDSVAGIVVGGLALGFVRQMSNYFLMSWLPGFGDAAAFILMLLVLLVKPYGLFGTERIERV